MADKNNKITSADYLDFEDKIAELDSQTAELRKLSSTKGIDYAA